MQYSQVFMLLYEFFHKNKPQYIIDIEIEWYNLKLFIIQLESCKNWALETEWSF